MAPISGFFIGFPIVMQFALSASLATNSSCMELWMIIREPAEQTSPWFMNIPIIDHSTAPVSYTHLGGKQAIPVDVQVIAASNRNLRERVAEGDFRDDLFYRLNTFPISVPPLRKRQRDIVPLVYLFAENFNSKYGTKKEFSLSSLNILQKYRWPGNVRELENLIERLILTVREDVYKRQALHCRNRKQTELPPDGIMYRDRPSAMEV